MKFECTKCGWVLDSKDYVNYPPGNPFDREDQRKDTWLAWMLDKKDTVPESVADVFFGSQFDPGWMGENC